MVTASARRPRFQHEELEDLVEKQNIILTKFFYAVTNEKKAVVWKSFTNTGNSDLIVGRNIEEVRRK